MSLPTNSKILNFPVRTKKCAMCDGVLVAPQPSHRYHHECWQWVKAWRGIQATNRAFEAMRGEQ